MTVVQLGVVVFAICLSTQVASQNSTVGMPKGNTTLGKVGNYTGTTMVTGTQSSLASNSSTAPYGASISLQSGSFSLLLPIAMATPLLHRYCWVLNTLTPLFTDSFPDPHLHWTETAKELHPVAMMESTNPYFLPTMEIEKQQILQDWHFTQKRGVTWRTPPIPASNVESEGRCASTALLHPSIVLHFRSDAIPSWGVQEWGCHVTCLKKKRRTSLSAQTFL